MKRLYHVTSVTLCQSVNKLDVDVMDSLEQFGGLLLPWNDCAMNQVWHCVSKQT